MTNLLARFMIVLSVMTVGIGISRTAHAEDQANQASQAVAAAQATGKPIVIHIHHHYYNAASTFGKQSPNLQNIDRNYPDFDADQQTLGNFVEPWKQDWDHLGFTGYLGQHNGYLGVEDDKSGLIVDTIKPDSPATKMGLVQGDFILKINDTQLAGYREVADLFEQTREDPKHRISMEIWNPHTRRTTTVNAILENLIPKKKPPLEEYPPEE
ncbi:MAG: PDZ domain-containing protein [Planctomycetales bacterium]